MLATLERPSDASVRVTERVAPHSTVATPKLTVLSRPSTEATLDLPPLPPAVCPAPVRRAIVSTPTHDLGHPRGLRRPASRLPVRESLVAQPLRITLRARRMLACLALLCAAGLGIVAVDLISALVPDPTTSYAQQFRAYQGDSAAEGGSQGLAVAGGSSIVVTSGDTLWSVAQRIAPHADPRSVIASIMTLNDLDSPDLQAGQVLRLP